MISKDWSKELEKDWAKELEAVLGKPSEVRKSTCTGLHSRTVYVIVDCSSSMAEGKKMVQARSGAVGFADEAQRKGYSVGLIQFASYAKHIIEPQNELTSLSTTQQPAWCGTWSLNDRLKMMIAHGSTNMAAAIQMAIDKLVDRAGEKVMCLVTDGMPDDQKAALDATNEARKKGIYIMTIGTDDADKDFLERLVTQKDLSLKVPRNQLEQGIVSMAKFLPGKSQ